MPSASVASSGPDPRGRERQAVGATTLPGAGRRDPDEVDPEPEVADEAAPVRAELLDRARAVRQLGSQALGPVDERGFVGIGQPQRPDAPGLADAGRVVPEPGAADHVDRRPHERGLDDAPILQRRGQRVAPEAGQPRPQPHVARWGVLGLEAADLVDRLGDGQRRALQEQLAGEERAVQGALGEDPLGHRRDDGTDGRGPPVTRLRPVPA